VGNYTLSGASGSVSITTAALSITANDDTKAYGDTKTYGAGSTEFMSSGLQNSETIDSVTITDSGSGGVAGANAGAYNLTPSAPIGGSFTAANYAITYNNGTLKVQPALTIVNASHLSGFLAGSIPMTIVVKDSGDIVIASNVVTVATFGGGSSFSITVGVSANSATISIKPHLYLRKKFVVPAEINSGNEGTLTITADFLGGDANNDNQVQGLDYAWLRAYWGQSGPVAGYDTNGDAVTDAADFPDLNGDAIIDALDYDILKDGWYQAGDLE